MSLRIGSEASEVEDEAWGAGAGDADHHAVVGLPCVLVEHGVAVVGDAVEDGCLAGAAGAFPQEDSTPIPASSIDVEDRLVRRDGQREVALGEVDLEGLVQDGLGQRLGDEPLDVQRALGPGRAAAARRREQRLGAAAVDLGVRLRLRRAGRRGR